MDPFPLKVQWGAYEGTEGVLSGSAGEGTLRPLNGCVFPSSSLGCNQPGVFLKQQPMETFRAAESLFYPRNQIRYLCAAGLKSSRPVARRASTYNCSERFSYICDDYLDSKAKQLIKKLVHFCMIDGKKTKSRLIVSQTLSRLSQQFTDVDVITLLALAIENVKPTCEVRRVRIAGTTRNVPRILGKKRQETLAFRWIVGAAVKRHTMSQNSQSLDQCLSVEILDAYRGKGSARRKRDDLHKLAEFNRSFAHYRWW